MTITCALDMGAGAGVVIGSDRRTMSGSLAEDGPDGKWVRVGSVAVGWAGFSAFRMIALNSPIWEPACPILDRVRDIREALRYHGWTSADRAKGGPTRYGLDLLIVQPDGLFSVSECSSVVRVQPDRLAAIGSGYEFAHGAAHVLREASAEAIVLGAIEAACALDAGCGGQPFIDVVEP